MSNNVDIQGIKAQYEERKRLIGNYLQRKAIRDHVAAVGGIGLPSKMPGTAYGIPAPLCGVGGKLAKRPGSVCHKCYAMRNNYTYPSVMTAQERRLESLNRIEEWVEAWCHIFDYLGALLSDEERYHRWHDSGDVQTVEHLDAILEVAERNDEWRFWLPSKEYGIVGQRAVQIATIDNLAVRMSAPWIGKEANEAVRNITGLTSTVGIDEADQCPARNQGGFCGSCRDCWDKSVANKNYPQH
jgi:hypothetical protein